MEADDLDNLIADSLGGVETALAAESRAAPSAGGESKKAAVGEAVQALRQGPVGEGGNEELFSALMDTLQDSNFQTSMGEVLQGGAKAEGEAESAESKELETQDYLKGFTNTFNSTVNADPEFDKDIESLMKSMLSNDIICQPLQQIADNLEPWLKSQKGLDASERSRYEDQLKLYKKIITLYKSNPDPLPEGPREEVQGLLAQLHALGQPPDEVMKNISPTDAAEGGETFEDFMKSMGLDQELGAAEQDLLKKLTEDPDELQKAMKEMAGSVSDEGCKQQ
eukprot:TRINITY_DN121041_c0_g1_i1.p1 TRINITY_DN121041_c0_g1~~TRINITY_DN121041_c0_g1_i1.p1  ORF type:complete len:281 (-),score=107.65 TRINITY_DN121041_c0_g1_i1:107-949(-)